MTPLKNYVTKTRHGYLRTSLEFNCFLPIKSVTVRVQNLPVLEFSYSSDKFNKFAYSKASPFFFIFKNGICLIAQSSGKSNGYYPSSSSFGCKCEYHQCLLFTSKQVLKHIKISFLVLLCFRSFGLTL